jgi:hypothetical protein
VLTEDPIERLVGTDSLCHLRGKRDVRELAIVGATLAVTLMREASADMPQT